MATQIPLSEDSSAIDPALDALRNDHSHEVAPDLAYRRLGIVNVVFWGPPRAGDREWVLIDTGLIGTKGFIRNAAAERFGRDSRPAAIVMTHGHFDHVGALEDLAKEWDVQISAAITPKLSILAKYADFDREETVPAGTTLAPVDRRKAWFSIEYKL